MIIILASVVTGIGVVLFYYRLLKRALHPDELHAIDCDMDEDCSCDESSR